MKMGSEIDCTGGGSNAIRIRRLGPSDGAAYQALRVQGLAEHPQAFTSSAREEAEHPLQWAQERLHPTPEKPHDFFLGAFLREELVGVVGLQGRYRPKERHNATVVGMFVTPRLSGRGAGRALMRELLAQAVGCQGLEQLDLTVTAGNGRALALYAACGFTVFGVLPRAIQVDGRYHDKIHMYMRLC
jgi:RimJ/RimL family protein N-acetyltransferase